ncbi:MAG: hypothetical protein HFE63_09655 [Clostridiales bacterium]|nr:hypothetical protein [Clostridiales bacterium]
MNRFFEWAYRTRGNSVRDLAAGKEVSMEKMFLSFMSHNPIFVSDGPAGLNGAVKGIGFIPKEEYLAAALEDYVKHIKTYDPADKTYSNRGLEVLMKWLYSEEAEKNIDFDHVYGVEMAFTNSYKNYQANPQCSMVFYQPPVISYELKGKMELIGEHHTADEEVDPFSLPILQQFINAQHDVYHLPNIDRWKTRPVYRFTIEEIYDKSSTKNGFGQKIL